MIKIRRRDNIPIYCLLFGICLGIIFSGALLLIEGWALGGKNTGGGLELVVAGAAFLLLLLLQLIAIEHQPPNE